MEASWPGCSLKLDSDTLSVAVTEEAPVAIPVQALTGFTVIEKAPVATGRAAVSIPDSHLILVWREEQAIKTARVPVPREGLQVKLFLERLAQVRPDADLRGLPEDEALQRLGLKQHARSPVAAIAIIALAVVAAIVVALLLRN